MWPTFDHDAVDVVRVPVEKPHLNPCSCIMTANRSVFSAADEQSTIRRHSARANSAGVADKHLQWGPRTTVRLDQQLKESLKKIFQRKAQFRLDYALHDANTRLKDRSVVSREAENTTSP